mgnify:CR=1 FL=1
MLKHQEDATVTLTNRTILRLIAFVVATVLVFRFISAAQHPLKLIFISFFLALALNPVVSWIARRLKNRSRVRATAVAYLSVLAVIIGFFALIIPPLVVQTRDFINDAPRIVEDFQRQNNSVANFARRYQIDEQLSKAASDFANDFGGDSGRPILDIGQRIGGTFVSIIAVVVLTFMMLVEGPQWLERVFASMPPAKRERRQRLAGRMYRMVTGFVNGQLILAILAGSSTLIALLIASTVLDASVNILALAGIVSLFALIPMIGNIISALIVVFVCLLSSPVLALVMLAFFLVYQQVENATLQPYVQSRQNELSPLIVFIAALLGVTLGGILGALAAIPLAGCLKILIEEYYIKPRNRATA